MRPVTLSISAAGATQPVPLDQYISPFNIGLAVDLSAGATLAYTVQHTFDDIYAANYNPATGNWFNHATMAAKTASSDGNYAFPVRATRLNVTAYTSGTATFKIVQAGAIV